MQYLSDKIKINDVLEENETLDKKSNTDDTINPLKGLFTGAVTGIATTPTGILGLFEAVPRTVGAVYEAATTDKTIKDTLLESLAENKMFNLTGKIDDSIRKTLTGKTYDELNSNEQLSSLTGELLPILASGGSMGLVKLGNLARKGSLNLAKKSAAKQGKKLSYSQAKKAINRADTLSNLALPGVQITKNTPLKTKLIEGSIQTAIPVGINEALRASTNQEGIFGDYSDNNQENITLFNDKRALRNKTYLDELDPEDYSTFTLDEEKQNEENKSNLLANTALIGGALLGSSYAVRKLKNLTAKELDSIKDVDNNSSILSESLSNSEKLDASVADRFAFRDKAQELGLISEETKNKLARDTSSIVNSAFNTGNLGDGVELGFSPQQTYTKIKSLKVNRPEDYDTLEKFIELNSKIQDEANSFVNYKYYENLSTDDYIAKVLNKDFNNNIDTSYSNSYIMSQKIKRLKELRQKINNNPELSNLLEEVSKIGEGLLKRQEKSRFFSPATIENLKKNRTIDGLFIYKPRIGKSNKKLLSRLKEYLYEDTPYNKNAMRDIETRGAEGISDAKDYFDVFERNFKQTLTEIEEESTKRSMIKEMVNGSFAKLDKLLDKYEDFYNNLSYDTSLSVLKNTTRKYIKDAKKILVARPIGSVRISDAVEEIQQPRNLFDILNKPKERNPLNDTVDKMFSEKKGEISKNIRSYRESKDIISYVEDGIEYFFKVDPIIKDAYNLSNGTVSLIGELLKKSKDLVQSTITGVLNPAFAIPSALMSTTEALTVLPKIISKLENVDGFSRLDYMKQIGKSFVKLYVDDVKNLIINLYERELVKTFGNLDTPMGKILSNFNIEKFKADITKSLLTKIKETGGASVRPLTSSRSNFYTLTKDSIISPAIERKLTNLYGVDGAYQVIKMFNFLQRAIREAPTLALTEYVGKLNKAIDINGEVDPKKLIQVVDVINNYTANVGKMGSGSGLLGAISKAISDYGLYGNVMIKSIAPKVRASGIDKGISNIYKLTKDLYDPNVRYYDILMNMQNNAKDLANNKFIQGLIFTSFIPTILAYLWNYGSKDNMETYHSLTDYDKASKLIFTNILGKNNHIILPIDQEVALSNTLFSTILDNILGMSAYNETDPAFDNSKLIMQALSRSFGLDSIPALDILANISGYDINLNMLDDKSFITPLKRNVINQDLSETAYQNGLVNQQTTQLINSIFGIAGSALLGSFEEANVGSNNETGFEDFNSSIVDRFTKSARLITGNKTISTYNETSKYVYNKRNLFNKIASIQNKNVKQQQIYEFIKLYKRNRIDPIHNTITSIRKELNNIRSLGIMNGQVLKYQERKDAANELNTKMQQYFAREYHEFQNLNDLLEQQFGNGITLDNFMEKLYE